MKRETKSLILLVIRDTCRSVIWLGVFIVLLIAGMIDSSKMDLSTWFVRTLILLGVVVTASIICALCENSEDFKND